MVAVANSSTDAVQFESFYVRCDDDPKLRRRIIASLSRVLGARVSASRLGSRGDSWLALVASAVEPGAAWECVRKVRDELKIDDRVILEPLFKISAKRAAPTKKSSGGGPPLACARDDSTWSLDITRTQRAWTLEPPAGGKRLGEGIRIAHPDTGYTNHPELVGTPPSRNRILAGLGYDFEDDRPDPRDPLDGSGAHGTATASVIMSDAGGATPFVAGIAPAAELVPLRVSDSVVHYSFTNVTKALHHAIDKAGAHVVSMSLGGPFSSNALTDAVQRATSEGIILLAAAGNVWPWVVYPARYEQVLAVAASNCLDEPWNDSASGSAVDITAPGESVWRAFTQRTKNQLSYHVAPSSGTSYAVATAAGACALWLAFHGRDNLIGIAGGRAHLGALFRRMVQRAARVPTGWDTANYGAGLLDVLDLLRIAPSASMPKSAAKKVRAKVHPQDRLEVLGSFFDEGERKRALARIEGKLGATPAERRRNLARLGDELAFHVATDGALRRSLAAPRKKSKLAPSLRIERGSAELRGRFEP